MSCRLVTICAIRRSLLLDDFPWPTTNCHYTDSPDLQWRWRLVSIENIPEMEVH